MKIKMAGPLKMKPESIEFYPENGFHIGVSVGLVNEYRLIFLLKCIFKAISND